MQVSGISQSAAFAQAVRPEAIEGAGPDHDGDADDAGTAVRAAQSAVQAAPGRVDLYA
jgi:hypothetical protein